MDRRNGTVGSRMVQVLAAAILAAAAVGVSCQKQTAERPGPKPTAVAPSAGKTMLTVKGSDTMVHLVSTWAEAFMKMHPDREVSVTGGGSGTGIAALLNGTTDVCAASREINEKEKKLAAEKGIQAVEIPVARDGIAVIVNPQNPTNTATMEQLKKIYTGAYTRWSQLGGPDQPIILLSRESSSGTYMFFQEHVLEKADYAQAARLMPATSAIIQEVAANGVAIGYVGLGYAVEAKDKVKMLQIKAKDDAPAVAPSEDAVKAGIYPIARKLYFYVNGAPSGSIKEFVDFCLSNAGQKIVTDSGYVTAK